MQSGKEREGVRETERDTEKEIWIEIVALLWRKSD